MNINIITLFPEIFEALNYGLLGQAIEREDIKINIFNLREHQINKHGQVDDKPYGGGQGMVLMAEPLEKSLNDIPINLLGRVINLSPQGSLLNHQKANELSSLTAITIVSPILAYLLLEPPRTFMHSIFLAPVLSATNNSV